LQKQSIQTFLQTKSILTYLILITLLISVIILGVSIGTVSIPLKDTLAIFKGFLFNSTVPESISMHENIIMNIRLPRVAIAGLVGASLSLVGAAFQGLLRNPLADPFTLGISSGASVGAVMTIFFGISIPMFNLYTLPFISIIAAFITLIIVITFARKIDGSLRVETIILTGIVFSSFLSALISLMITLTGEELRQIIGWLLGSVAMRSWEHVLIILPFFVIGSFILLLNARELNAFSFGEDQAKHIGVNVDRKKMVILIAGSMLTGAAVSVSGVIGFVGLVIPHFVRIIFGPEHISLMPKSMIIGAVFLIIADLVSRIIIQPQELPIGVITALIGAPIFAVILIRQKVKGVRNS